LRGAAAAQLAASTPAQNSAAKKEAVAWHPTVDVQESERGGAGDASRCRHQAPGQQHNPGIQRADYSSRKSAGKVEVTDNPSAIKTDLSKMKRPKVLEITEFSRHDEIKACRHMLGKLNERAGVLDEMIDDIGDKMVRKHKLLAAKTAEADAEQLSHVALPNQERVTVVGRVCLDGREGKLNAASVLLEGSRETSNGARVAVDLSSVPEFSLFPGQVVAAQGTNTTGTVFTPDVIFQGAPKPMQRTAPEQLREHYFSGEDDGVEAVEVLMAAGPYTVSSNLEYEPLQDLLDVVRRDPPDVLVLMGPFVSEDHAIVQNGDMEVTYEEKFDQVITEIADVILKELKTTELVLIPSLKDVHHDRVYPQPPFQLPTALQEHEGSRVHGFANPSTFTVKEVVIGVTATDTLFDLTKQETSRGQSGDRMGRLANHVLQQRTYCPIVPAPLGMNVEYDKHTGFELPVTPDVLVMPSQLRHFVKNVNNTLVINPGSMAKHNNGGTFSRIAIHAPRMMDIPSDEKPILNGIHARSVVQVIRI